MYADRNKKNDPQNPVRLNALGRYASETNTHGRHYESSGLGLAPMILATALPVVKSAVSKVVPKVSFATPSDKRASGVVGQVVQAANAGNLNAVVILDSRRNIGVAAERAVWAKGFVQVSPAVLSVYAPHRNDLISAIPESAQASPEAAASWALQSPVSVQPSVLQQVADTVVPVLLNSKAGQQVKAAAISAAVNDQAAQGVDLVKKYALPVGIGLALLLFMRRGR